MTLFHYSPSPEYCPPPCAQTVQSYSLVMHRGCMRVHVHPLKLVVHPVRLATASDACGQLSLLPPLATNTAGSVCRWSPIAAGHHHHCQRCLWVITSWLSPPSASLSTLPWMPARVPCSPPPCPHCWHHHQKARNKHGPDPRPPGSPSGHQYTCSKAASMCCN